jgi:diadenosine tetraphosphate (Ap4A) HIT family hydrolase
LWRDAFYRRARPSGTVQDFDDLTEKDRQHLTHAAQAMLSAARKQVTQDED